MGWGKFLAFSRRFLPPHVPTPGLWPRDRAGLRAHVPIALRWRAEKTRPEVLPPARSILQSRQAAANPKAPGLTPAGHLMFLCALAHNARRQRWFRDRIHPRPEI